MGCNSTKAQTPLNQRDGPEAGQPLTNKEIQDRIEAPPRSETLEIDKFRIRYAFISQRGFYPDDRDKANQDAYSVIPQFDGAKDQALFAVFDGHGKEGDLCAGFCRDHLPKNVARELRKGFQNRNVEDCLVRSFVDTNEQLHADPNVDDSLSGTTAVGVFIDGRDMYVANVGDSRAIVVQEHEGKLVAKPLSSDQTPYRKDERERVKACGARVMSMDQIEGLEPIHENWGDVNLGEELDEGGDPPRIWSPFGEYPGTAFTRSMGDVIAEELGVYAEPEIIHRKIHVCDRFIVIASDGVFEFLTNQSVADMVARYSDPLEACKKVVQEAYDLWLQYEVRTDDITIITLFIEGVTQELPDEAATEVDLDNIALEGLRPVRREMSRQRQRQFIMHHESFLGSPSTSPRDREEPYSVEQHVVAKLPEERTRILTAIKSNFLFEHITEQQRQVLLDVMQKVLVKQGDWVIRQGDDGDRFYIIDSGKFEVRVNQDVEKVRDPENAGILVHVYEPTDNIKPCFGHLALLYSKPRSASVFARTDGVLWALDRPVFRKILMKKSRREIARTLRRVDVLKSLNLQQLQNLCDVLQDVTYSAGQYIIRQGEVGDTFFIIDEGGGRVTVTKEDGTEKLIRRLREYDYFGERALLTSEPRSANVIADKQTTCLTIGRKAFEEVLGSLQHIIDADRKNRERRPGQPVLSELRVLGAVSKDELGQVNLCKMTSSNSTYSLRTMWKTDIQALKQRHTVMKAGEMLRHVTESLTTRGNSTCVPLLAGMYNADNALHLLQQVAVVCTLSSLLDERESLPQLPQECVRHLGACVILGLDALHRCNVIYRAMSPELVYMDNRGYAVLMEYRLSKLGLNNGFTLCGTPEYLAPEQVRHLGHGKAVDYWALGVLLYELSKGVSPFHAESEIDVYTKINNHRAGKMNYPTSFSPALCDLLDRLLHPDPDQRLGAGANDLATIKTHQWFAGFDWGGLSKGEYFNQELRQAAHEKFQKAMRGDGGLNGKDKAFIGDQTVWERFE